MYGSVDWTSAGESSTLGSSWRQAGDGIGISGGRAVPLGTSAGLARWATSLGGDDGWVEATVLDAPVTAGEIGVIIRSTSSSAESGTGYYMFRYNASSNRLQLMRKDDSTATLTALGTSYSYVLQNGDRLRIEIEGTTLRGVLNSGVIMTVTDTVLAASSTYRYGGIRTKDTTAMSLSSFSMGDTGVTGPGSGGGTVTSQVINHTWGRWDGAAIQTLEMMGVWDGAVVQPSTLELLGPYQPTTPPATGGAPALGFTPLRTINVATATELYAAIDGAQPGDLINMADGTYLMDPTQADCVTNGTASNPIGLFGSRNAIITTGDYTSGKYGLHASGDYWRFLGFRITNAKKGFVLDGANFAYLDSIEVDHVGHEAVHFRSASADGTIINSLVHETGLDTPSFGEGIYVGSANSNWGTQYNGVYYGENGGTGPDRSDRCQVINNYVWNTKAEGIDIKEGTVNGVLRGNLFEACGWTGANSADSAVDVKGNLWTIAQNTISPLMPDGSVPGDSVNPSSSFLDAIQTHVVYSGWGESNIFDGNILRNSVTGYVISITPEPDTHSNIVYDNNYGPGAQSGISNITLTATP